MMAATDLFFITISRNVPFIGKTWWMLMLVLRLLVLLPAGLTLFSDEQERFICNTIQPGCSNVCFDVFAPVSVLRLWLLHLVLLCLPHLVFATYVMHEVLSHRYFGGFYCSRSGGGSPLAFQNSSFSRELSLRKAPLPDLPHECREPRFHCAYLLVVILRILLEATFSAAQFFLFGLTVPKSFLCYEAPCTSGVQCYISRPTEKALMLNLMLAVDSLSILLSLVDLVSSTKATVRWRRKREVLMDEMSKGEQSSMFTTTSVTEDSDVLLTRRSPSDSSKVNNLKDERPDGELFHVNGGGPTLKTSDSAAGKSPESKDVKASPPPTSTPVPTPFVLHSHSRPPLSPPSDRGPLTSPRAPTPIGVKKLGQYAPVGTVDSSDSQDKRAWV